jgi:carbon monoxide dehydrogenase subunit G
MIQLSETRAIARSPGEVFAFLADLKNFPKWRANLVSFKILTEGPTEVGTRCSEVVQVGPMRATGTCDVTEFFPGRTMAFTATSAGIVYDGRILVEPWDAGSKLTLTGDVHPRGPMKLMQPVLRRKLERGIQQEVSAVKELLERHVTSPVR